MLPLLLKNVVEVLDNSIDELKTEEVQELETKTGGTFMDI